MNNSTGHWNLRALLRLGAVVLLVAASTVACTDETPAPIPTPTPPPTTTDTFTDTLKVNGAFSYPFPVVAIGSLTATLTSVSDATIAVSLSLGTWNGASCQVVIANDKALQGAVVPATVTAVGSYCVRISDVGFIVDPVTFQISVVHP
jgi:hypothetical protein